MLRALGSALVEAAKNALKDAAWENGGQAGVTVKNERRRPALAGLRGWFASPAD